MAKKRSRLRLVSEHDPASVFDDLEALRARFVEEGVFVRPFGSVIYLTPAFTITAQELAKLTEAVTKIVSAR